MAGSDYYDHRTFPSHGAAGSSSGMRSELGDIEAGFGKLPDLVVANASLPVFINASGTAQEAISADSARAKLGTGTNLWCGTATGTANALTLTPTPAVTAYAPGQRFFFKSGAAANTTAVIAAVSGLPAIAVQVNGAACVGGEIAANSWYEVFIDASLTSCQLSKIGRATFTELGISAFAQTILDDANAAAVRTTVGAAALAGLSTQIFAVANAVGANDAIPLGQADTRYAAAATVAQATETVMGTAQVATQPETDAGTIDTDMVTPKKLRNGFASSLTTNGYIKLPSWLLGLIFQWGQVASATYASGTNTTLTITHPLTFPTAVWWSAMFFGTKHIIGSTTLSSTSTTTGIDGNLNNSGGASLTTMIRWFSLGT